MRRFDDTPTDENESECPCCADLALRVALLRAAVAELAAEVADLHYRRRVSRDQVVNLDPEWY